MIDFDKLQNEFDTIRRDDKTLGEKVEYVKRQPRGTGHECHWPGCGLLVPPSMWGCSAHWYALPKHLRDRMWKAYKPGQEITKRPSLEYVNVARDVQEWIAANSK